MFGSIFKPPKNIDETLAKLKFLPAAAWEFQGKKNISRLIKYVARNVPAYQSFLKENGVNYKWIKGFEDLAALPVSDKNNYLKKYSYINLFPRGSFYAASTISASSGTSGEPFYFPRGENQDRIHDYILEALLKNNFEIHKKRTLILSGFALGIWVAGILSYRTFKNISHKYPLTIGPIGSQKSLFLKTFKKFGNFFDQIILCGYPPFIKDVIDQALEYKINFSDYSIKVLCGAEGFSEKFRDYLVRKSGAKSIYGDVLNIYGSAEMHAMAHETPLSNFIRRLARKNKSAFKALFPEANRLPSLFQYHPYIIWFEQVNGELLATSYNGSIPLIRYRFPDRGGVITFDEMVYKMRQQGVDLMREARKNDFAKTVLKLPFVYVYERSDFAQIVRGANIYPDQIKEILETAKLEKHITGKFALEKMYNKKMNEFLKIYIELRKGAKPSSWLQKYIASLLVNGLSGINSEFNYLYESDKKSMIPRIILRAYEDPLYFKAGAKQKWAVV